MRILLIEDDPMVGRAVRRGLLDAGFVVDWLRDGQAAQLALANAEHDLAVLDLGLPGQDGMQLLRQMRARGNAMPVLVVTARDAVADRIAGLHAGADDYLLKPFDFDELVARVHALLRRCGGTGAPCLVCGALVLDPVRRSVHLAQQPVDLTAREFDLLQALMQRPGAVLSRQRLEASIYGWGQEVESNAIEVHLHKLRRKLGSGRIHNLRGVGYRVAALE